MSGTAITPSRRSLRWFAVPVAALSVFGAAACGTPSNTAATTGSAAQGGTQGAEGGAAPAGMQKLINCMGEHGVTMPSPGGDGPGGQGGSGRPGGGGGTPPAGDGSSDGGPDGSADGAGGASGPGGGKGSANGARPDPATAPPGVDQATWTTARKACAAYAPSEPRAGAGAEQQTGS
ncbi:MAG TPA: hypothetical protein VGH99_15660 [Pseudonocardia sp.]|jgi:hypothetical protein